MALTEAQFTEALKLALQGVEDLTNDRDVGVGWISDVGTFGDSGVMSSNDGLVVTLGDGCEFQMTIVRSQ